MEKTFNIYMTRVQRTFRDTQGEIHSNLGVVSDVLATRSWGEEGENEEHGFRGYALESPFCMPFGKYETRADGKTIDEFIAAPFDYLVCGDEHHVRELKELEQWYIDETMEENPAAEIDILKVGEIIFCKEFHVPSHKFDLYFTDLSKRELVKDAKGCSKFVLHVLDGFRFNSPILHKGNLIVPR